MIRAATIALALVAASAPFAGAGPAIDLGNAELKRKKLPKMYRLEFEVDGASRGLCILFNYHDKANFAALRLDGQKTSLLDVTGGKLRSQAMPMPPGTEGRIFVRPGHAFVEIGGAGAAATVRVPPGGKYGSVRGTGGALTRLVMRREEAVYFTDDFMRAEGTGEHWRPRSGKWAIRYERDTQRSANPFRCIARSTGAGLMITGERYWHEYTASASVSGAGGTVGLAFALQDENNYHLFRLGIGRGKSELIRVRAGKETVLASSPKVLHENQWDRISVRADGAGIVCTVGGRPLLASPAVAAVGKIGLYVTDAAQTLFDDIAASSSHLAAQRKPPIELFSKAFESDQQMENWASLWGAWRPQTIRDRTASLRRMFWHKGEFYGDVSIGWPTGGQLEGAKLEVLLVVGGDGRDIRQGGRLRVHRTDDSDRWTLSLNDKELASKTTRALGDTVVTLALRGDRLVALDGDNVVLRSGPVRLPGRILGLGANGVKLDLHKIEIRSDHVQDYLFEGAPVEWLTRTGTWQITNRWVCDPRWSWLGGTSKQVAQMWTKRSFHGDQTVEFFGALKMQAGIRYPHVGDINLTICGDGRNLDSGYQVVFAGWGNRWTRLLKRGKVVAGSGDAIIRGNFHRRWFHVKIRKAGGIVQMFIDNELIRTYKDPQPLEGGHIALWTVDNGMMIARVRIYSERTELRPFLKDGARPKPLAPGDAEGPPAGHLVYDDFKKNAGRWSSRDGEQGARLERAPDGLMLVNTNCGGSFGATMYDRRFDLAKSPVVRLGYRIVSEEPVCLNLFARINGRLFEIPLTAPPESRIATTLQGGPKLTFHGKPDGRTRHAEMDLGARVEAWYRRTFRRPPPGLWATELYLANASNRKYLQCGFGGNRAGARLCITSFAIKARK